MSLTWFQGLQTSAIAEVEAAFYAKTAAAEAARPAETAAAVRLQSAWRGRTTRVLIAFWAEHALLMENFDEWRKTAAHNAEQITS